MLTLGVFGGAAEHVISGSALLAFAGGWAMLAYYRVGSPASPNAGHECRRPSWLSPGCAVVARPDDRALNNAGWVWPPVVLAVAVWMVIQLRRGLGGRVSLADLPGRRLARHRRHRRHVRNPARADDQKPIPPAGTYDVGGHRLHLNCTGTGSPTVVLENGLGGHPQDGPASPPN